MRSTTSHTLPRPAGLVECASVIDVGAGIRPMQWYRPGRHVCVEPHEPYAAVLRSAGYEVVVGRAADVLGGMDADAVYLLDVIEHMERAEALRAIELACAVARKQVVIYTPLGFLEQTHDAWGMGGEHWQTHRSGWTPADFRGWSTETFSLAGVPRGFYALWETT